MDQALVQIRAVGALQLVLADFAKAFACESKPGGAQRALGSQFMAKLSSLQFGPGEHFPCVLNATICTQLSSPASRIEDGVCKLLNPAAVARCKRRTRGLRSLKRRS